MIGVVAGLWANKESSVVPTSQYDSGFRRIGEVVGLRANEESWGSKRATVIVVLGG